MIEDTEVAWAAGFFDGEGNCGLHRQTTTWQKKNKNGEKISGKRNYWKRYPALTVSQVTSEELYRFDNATNNVGKVRGPYGPYKTTKQAYYQYSVFGYNNIKEMYKVLKPYLCSRKKEQIEDVLKRYLEQEKN